MSDPNFPNLDQARPTPEPHPEAPGRWSGLWHQVSGAVSQLRPTQQLTRWFSVDDEKVAEILTTVRSQLPTTEALLIVEIDGEKASVDDQAAKFRALVEARDEFVLRQAATRLSVNCS